MSTIVPMQQQALAQMLTMQGQPAPQQSYLPAASGAGALNSSIQPLIQALAYRRMQDMLAQRGPSPQAPQQPAQPPQMQQAPADPYADIG